MEMDFCIKLRTKTVHKHKTHSSHEKYLNEIQSYVIASFFIPFLCCQFSPFMSIVSREKEKKSRKIRWKAFFVWFKSCAIVLSNSQWFWPDLFTLQWQTIRMETYTLGFSLLTNVVANHKTTNSGGFLSHLSNLIASTLCWWWLENLLNHAAALTVYESFGR